MKRRELLSGAVGTAAILGFSAQLSASEKMAQPSSLNILILGGTGFIGPPMVSYAVERGHNVSIFTRGRSALDIDGVEQLVGDRNDDLSALEGRKWDVVFDNNTYDYKWVSLSTEALKDNVGRYVFISSVSAYAGEHLGFENVDKPYTGPRISIDSPLAAIPDDFEFGDELEYGQMKVMSEKIVREAFPDNHTIVRPGFIVGPGDPTDRFTYWPLRIERGGEVLVPGDGNDEVQVIDVRDLMEFTVRLAENGTNGIFNGVGPASPLSMAGMVYGIRSVTNSNVSFTWVPIPFLREKEVTPYFDMPIWIPGDPLGGVDNSHAQEAGLTFRSLAKTVSDTLAWHRTRPAENQEKPATGIDPEKEKAVLAAWHAHRAG